MTSEPLRPFLSNSGFSLRLSVSFGMEFRGKGKSLVVLILFFSEIPPRFPRVSASFLRFSASSASKW